MSPIINPKSTPTPTPNHDQDPTPGLGMVPDPEIDAIMRGEVEIGPADHLAWLYEDIIAGRITCWNFEHPQASSMTQALMPATNTLLNGSPGNGKSLYLQQVMLGLHRQRVPIAYLHLEYQLTTHLRRAHAQMAEASRLANMEWVKFNPTEVRELCKTYQEQINSFGSCITCLDKAPFQKDVLAWVKDQAAAGKKVLAIDPLTKIRRPPGSYTPDADENFLDELSSIGKEFGCALIAVTHPKSSPFRSASDMLSNMAGGAAWERFALTVFFLEYLKDPLVGVECHAPGLTSRNDEDHPISRILNIVKANNGTGNGTSLGYYFDPKTLRYSELGKIVKGTKGKWK